MKVLIIDDDLDLCASLKAILLAESDTIVEFAHDGEIGAKLARTNQYDIIILDYNLPKQNGQSVCARIRDQDKNTPILMLTIVAELDTKVMLLETGADDYLTKPFSSRELTARLQALVRRSQINIQPIKIGPLVIDTVKQTAHCQRRPLNLPHKQYLLLEHLAKQPGKIISKATIMEKIWELDSNVWSNTLEAHLCELRKHLQAETGKQFIRTIPGRGYKLVLPT